MIKLFGMTEFFPRKLHTVCHGVFSACVSRTIPRRSGGCTSGTPAGAGRFQCRRKLRFRSVDFLRDRLPPVLSHSAIHFRHHRAVAPRQNIVPDQGLPIEAQHPPVGQVDQFDHLQRGQRLSLSMPFATISFATERESRIIEVLLAVAAVVRFQQLIVAMSTTVDDHCNPPAPSPSQAAPCAGSFPAPAAALHDSLPGSTGFRVESAKLGAVLDSGGTPCFRVTSPWRRASSRPWTFVRRGRSARRSSTGPSSCCGSRCATPGRMPARSAARRRSGMTRAGARGGIWTSSSTRPC